jgi:hypothetical protein
MKYCLVPVLLTILVMGCLKRPANPVDIPSDVATVPWDSTQIHNTEKGNFTYNSPSQGQAHANLSATITSRLQNYQLTLTDETDTISLKLSALLAGHRATVSTCTIEFSPTARFTETGGNQLMVKFDKYDPEKVNGSFEGEVSGKMIVMESNTPDTTAETITVSGTFSADRP